MISVRDRTNSFVIFVRDRTNSNGVKGNQVVIKSTRALIGSVPGFSTAPRMVCKHVSTGYSSTDVVQEGLFLQKKPAPTDTKR